MARVRLENLSKWYGSQPGLHRLDLQTGDGEFRVIFGPAGAGKTTTLNLIAGIVAQSGGSVHIGDRCVDRVAPADRNIAMVFESYALYPHMDVFDNIAFPLRGPGHRQPEQAIRKVVTRLAESMKIDHLLERRIQQLSNGQRQRVALGRALVRQPDVFLLDEPLSHLDAKLRHSMRAEFKEMRQHMDTTTFYVTHDYLEALSLADRITVLSGGRVLQDGSPDEVFFSPASTEVASLFGDPEINLVPASLGALNGTGPGLRLFGSGRQMPLPGIAQDKLDRLGDSLVVGVRPPDVLVCEEGTSGLYRGRVYSYEPLGIHDIATIDTGEGRPLVRAIVRGGRKLLPDQPVEFSVRQDALLLFDGETGQFRARSGGVSP